MATITEKEIQASILIFGNSPIDNGDTVSTEEQKTSAIMPPAIDTALPPSKVEDKVKDILPLLGDLSKTLPELIHLYKQIIFSKKLDYSSSDEALLKDLIQAMNAIKDFSKELSKTEEGFDKLIEDLTQKYNLDLSEATKVIQSLLSFQDFSLDYINNSPASQKVLSTMVEPAFDNKNASAKDPGLNGQDFVGVSKPLDLYVGAYQGNLKVEPKANTTFFNSEIYAKLSGTASVLGLNSAVLAQASTILGGETYSGIDKLPSILVGHAYLAFLVTSKLLGKTKNYSIPENIKETWGSKLLKGSRTVDTWRLTKEVEDKATSQINNPLPKLRSSGIEEGLASTMLNKVKPTPTIREAPPIIKEYISLLVYYPSGNGKVGKKIVFPFIPQKWDFTFDNQWATIRSAARNNPFYHYVGSEDNLTFRVDWWDLKGDMDYVISNCKLIESLMKGNRYREKPPMVQIVLGSENNTPFSISAYDRWIVANAPYTWENWRVPFKEANGRTTKFETKPGLRPVGATQDIMLKRVVASNPSWATIASYKSVDEQVINQYKE